MRQGRRRCQPSRGPMRVAPIASTWPTCSTSCAVPSRCSAATNGSRSTTRCGRAWYAKTGLGEPPVVVFVVEDEEKALQFLRAADKAVTGRVGKWGTPEESWPHHGRRRLFV